MEDSMKSTSRKAVVVGAWVTTGVLAAAALTGVAMAADPSPSPSATGTTTATSTTGTHAATGARAEKLRGLGKRVLHGEFTVQTKAGVKVYDTEIGVITSASPTSVAVKASDGFTQTWTLDATTRVRANKTKGTVSDLKVGETVRLLGPTSGGTATAQLALVRPASS
jgi:hypothetical protein